MTETGMHTGWKSIAKRIGAADADTARSWVKRYSIPVIKLGRLVHLDESVFRSWYANYHSILLAKDQMVKPPEDTPLNPPSRGNKGVSK
jgi:hypothetical protein